MVFAKKLTGYHKSITQVNVLSPEIFGVMEVDAFISDGRQHSGIRYGEYIRAPSGSEAML